MNLLIFLVLACASTLYCSKIPIIIDTDVGHDFDDSWAIALALSSPELDVKLILTATHNAYGRAQIVAKYLEAANRTDISVGVGLQQDNYVGPLYGWAADYDLMKYPGKLYMDGVQQAINIIQQSDVPVVIVAIAPATNIKQMLVLAPSIGARTEIKAMSGNYKGCINGSEPCAEWNVAQNVSASQAMYAEGWKMSTTPLDTCGQAIIDGDIYQTLLGGNNTAHPVLQTLLENFVYWHYHGGWGGDPKVTSSTLFDAVASYMAFSDESFCDMQLLNVAVNSQGLTVVGANGKPVDVCLTWANNGQGLTKWQALVVQRLLANTRK